ncbi:MAG: hypothetical protein ACXVHQ_41780 [Solirubrobacteraceae bacterium]
MLIVGGGHNGPGDPYDTLRAVAGWLSADGIASLRYDKLTTGKTGWDGSAADPARVGMQPFKQEAAAALVFLARQRSIDRRRLVSGLRAQRGRRASMPRLSSGVRSCRPRAGPLRNSSPRLAPRPQKRSARSEQKQSRSYEPTSNAAAVRPTVSSTPRDASAVAPAATRNTGWLRIDPVADAVTQRRQTCERETTAGMTHGSPAACGPVTYPWQPAVPSLRKHPRTTDTRDLSHGC